MAKNAKLNYRAISTGKLRRYFSLQNFVDPFKIARGYLQARKIIKQFQPDVVFCAGGFVSVPVGLAAHHLGKKIILNEADASAGLSTKILSKYAHKVCIAFPNAAEHLTKEKVELTGLPTNPIITKGTKIAGKKLTGLKGKLPIILVMGGSLGAEFVNNLVYDNLADLTKNYQVIHLTGRGKSKKIKMPNYISKESVTLKEMADLYAFCDVCITRAGANSVFELAENGKKMLMIPLPLSASRGDQILNAEYFEKLGYGVKLDQDKLNYKVLKQNLAKVLKSKKVKKMSSGLNNVIKIIKSCV